jgi:hypothetical protein
MTYGRDPLREEGLAILSRWPIAAWEAVEPASAADQRGRTSATPAGFACRAPAAAWRKTPPMPSRQR